MDTYATIKELTQKVEALEERITRVEQAQTFVEFDAAIATPDEQYVPDGDNAMPEGGEFPEPPTPEKPLVVMDTVVYETITSGAAEFAATSPVRKADN